MALKVVLASLLLAAAWVGFLWPVVDVLVRSLNVEGAAAYNPSEFVFINYLEVVRDPILRRVVLQTINIALWTTAVSAVIGIPVAYLISRLRGRTATIVTALVVAPLWISVLARLFGLRIMLGREGMANQLLAAVGLGGPYELLFSTFATVLGTVAYVLPLMVLVFYAGMRGVDYSLVQASATLGASTSQSLRFVIFPIIKGSLVSGALLGFILSLGFFLTPVILGGPQDQTIPVFMQQKVNLFEWGQASAVGILLLAITLVGYMVVLRLQGTAAFVGGGGGTRGTANVERLRATPGTVALWVLFVATVCFLLAPMLVVAPTSFSESALLTWPPRGFTWDWYALVFSDPAWVEPFYKSLKVCFGTALSTTLLAVFLARRLMFIRSKAGRALLLVLGIAPLVVPRILFAIGTYDIQGRIGLLDSYAGLILAYTFLSLPFAFIIMTAAFTTIGLDQEIAAQSLGASNGRAFWGITLMQVAPAMIASALVSFIASWDEVIIALFQTSFEKTLPVQIFANLRSGMTPAVSAIATTLVLVAVGVGVLSWGVSRLLSSRGMST